MKLIVVRHGLSEANKVDIIGTDSDLAPEGRQQAIELAKRLSEFKIEAIYCSPLKRAQQTAQPVATDQGIKIQTDDRIREVDWGDFDGKAGSFYRETIGVTPHESLDLYDFDFHKYHGESVLDLEARIKSFVEDIKSKPYKTALVVCHGGPVRVLNYVITGQRIPYQSNGKEIHLEI